MARPFKHPKTGVYWIRKVVPPELRAVVGKRELKVTLGTKDPREAKAKAGPILQRFEAIITAARVGGNAPSQRTIDALCGEWYREQCQQHGDDPGQPEHWDLYLSHLSDQVEDVEAWEDQERRIFLTLADRTEAKAMLEAHGYLADQLTAPIG